MRKLLLLLTLLAALLPAAEVSAGDTPAPTSKNGYFCADRMMPVATARRMVLVTLQETINGKSRNDIALVVKQWDSHKSKAVGYAHPDCWTALPVRPGTAGHRPTLCLVVRPPFRAVSPSPKSTAPAACPTPVTYRTSGVRWVTYTFRVAAG